MANPPSLDFTLPSANTQAAPASAPSDQQGFTLSFTPQKSGLDFSLPGAAPQEQPKPDQSSTDVIGDITKDISQGYQDLTQGDITGAFKENIKDEQQALKDEYNNVAHNNMLIAGVKVLTGTTDYDVNLKTLTDEQNTYLQKLDLLNAQAKAGHGNPTLQRFFLQQNINVSQKISALAQQQIADSWTVNKDSMAKAGAAVYDMVKDMASNPKSAFKAMGNSLLADPELFGLGSVFDAIKGVGTATKSAFDISKGADAAEALAEGTSRASATQAWTAADTTTVINAQAKTGQAIIAAHTLKGDLRAVGVGLGKIGSQAAIFTPLNLVQTWNEKGSIGPSDVARGIGMGIGFGVATSALHWYLKPTGTDLPTIRAAAGSTTTLNDAVKQFTGVDPLEAAKKNPPKVKPLPEGTEEYGGIEVSEKANLSAALDAVVKSGGSYNADDYLDPEVREEQEALQHDTVLRAKIHLDNADAQGITETSRLPNGLIQLPDDIFVRRTTDDSGQTTHQTTARQMPDSTIRIFRTDTIQGQRGQRLAATSYSTLADHALAAGTNLTSDWKVSPNAESLWTKALPNLGYQVIKDEGAIFDPLRNETITTSGNPVYRVVGKRADTPSPPEQELTNSIDALHKQAGRVDPRVLAGIAVVGGAGAYGYATGGTKTALEDAGMAAAAALLGPKLIRATSVKGAGTLNPNNAAFKTLDDLNGELTSLPLMASHVRNNINALVPDSENLYKNLVKDPTAQPMTDKEQQAYNTVRGLLNTMGKRAKNAGAIQSLIQDYFTRWWQPKAGSPLEADWGNIKLRKPRSLTNGAEGLAAAHAMGLEPKTTNVGDLMQHYILGMHRATVLRETADALKQVTGPDGQLLVQPRMKAPKNYLPMKGLLNNYSAHPDVAVLGNMLFDMPEPGMLAKYYDLANYSLKRTVLSFTLFHPKNLAMNFMMAGGHPLDIPQAFNPGSDFQTALQYGGNVPGADYIRYAAKSGLEFSIDKTPEDYGNDAFYRPLESLSAKLDNYVPGAGLFPKGITATAHLNDKVAFQLAQNYFKFSTWSRIFEDELSSASNKHLMNPDKYPEPNRDQIAQKAAVVANDLFGGQNYYQTIRQMKPGWLQQVMGDVLSPSSRKVLQRIILAPDWTISVARSFGRAFTAQGSKAAYARYLAGAASFYAAAAVTQNLVTGKWPWEVGTKPGYITWQDGSTTQWDKQIAEAGEWVNSPGQASLNKLSMPVRFAGQDVLNEKYLSTKGAPQIHKPGAPDWLYQDVVNSVKQAAPIGVQQATQAHSLGEATGSFFGLPTYPAPKNTSRSHHKMSPWETMERERTRRMNALRGH